MNYGEFVNTVIERGGPSDREMAAQVTFCAGSLTTWVRE